MVKERHIVCWDEDYAVVKADADKGTLSVYPRQGALKEAADLAIDLAEKSDDLSVGLAAGFARDGSANKTPIPFETHNLIKIEPGMFTSEVVVAALDARHKDVPFEFDSRAKAADVTVKSDRDTGTILIYPGTSSDPLYAAQTALFEARQIALIFRAAANEGQEYSIPLTALAAGKPGDENTKRFSTTNFMQVKPESSVIEILHARQHARQEQYLEETGRGPGNVIHARLIPGLEKADVLSAAIDAWCMHTRDETRPTVKFQFNGCLITVNDQDQPLASVSCVPPDRRVYRAPAAQK